MNKSTKKTSKKTPAQKAWATRKASAKKASKKASVAKLTPAQKAWVTIRAKKAALKPVKVGPVAKTTAKTVAPAKKAVTYQSAFKNVAKAQKLVTGVIKDGPTNVFTTKTVAPKPAPKYKTIAELFASEDRWTKFASGKDKDGKSVGSSSEKAVSFCLGGAVDKIYGTSNKYLDVNQRLNEIIEKYSLGKRCGIVDFNDHSTTTFADIQRVVSLANV